ncbi:MAG: universal stress protein, partial [Halobacterium sp.]
AAVTEAAGAETEVVEVIEHGTPADVVLEYADEADVDLLVLGTRQRPEAYRTLIGSVTDRVVRLADRPTLVVKTPHEGA